MCQFPITDKNHLFLHACFNGSEMCNMHVNITVRGGFLALEHDVAAELPQKKGGGYSSRKVEPIKED